jgi:hypothetical protein
MGSPLQGNCWSTGALREAWALNRRSLRALRASFVPPFTGTVVNPTATTASRMITTDILVFIFVLIFVLLNSSYSFSFIFIAKQCQFFFLLFKWIRNTRVLHVHLFNEDKVSEPADNFGFLLKKISDSVTYSKPNRTLNSYQQDHKSPGS